MKGTILVEIAEGDRSSWGEGVYDADTHKFMGEVCAMWRRAVGVDDVWKEFSEGAS